MTVSETWKRSFHHVCAILLLTRIILSCALAMEDTHSPIHVDENIVYFVDVSIPILLYSSLTTLFASNRVTFIPKPFC